VVPVLKLVDKEPNKPEQDQFWAYKEVVDKFSPKGPAPVPGSEENRTMVGLRAVQGRGENPYLPQPPTEPAAPSKDVERRHDFMAP